MSARACTSTAAAPGSSTATPPSSRTSPTSASTASTPAQAPRPITPEPPRAGLGPLRRRPRDPRRAADRVRARDPRRGGEPVNELVALPADGERRAARARLGPRLLLLPAPEPRRRHARVDLLGPPEHALGRHRALGGAAGGPDEARLVAGGPSESIWQPEWSPDGVLHFVSDRSGWWNLYREGEQLTREQAELGYPQWGFGGSSYAFLDDGRIVVRAGGQGGYERLCILRPRPVASSRTSGCPTRRGLPAACGALGDRVIYAAESPAEEEAVVTWSAGEGATRGVGAPERARSTPRGRPSRARSSSRPPAGAPRTPSGTRRTNPRLRGAGRASAADHRAEPRRAHRATRSPSSTRRSRSGRAAGSASWT